MIADVRDIEHEVVRIVREVLENDDVRPDDDFLTLGGDSLTATVVASEIEKRCGVRLSLQDVLEAPTLAALAARVHGR